MKLIATQKQEQNHAMIDPWTVVHFSTGLAAGLLGVPRRLSHPAAVAYELVEQYMERQKWGREFFETHRHESVPNAVVDVVVFAVGHYLGEAWNDTRAPSWKSWIR
ncbi:MAG: hypothetical protein U5R14_13515 [Gemmatimonadota bacterium]|nr:hypothetical protein [Gemmatimonadota bacterium]